MSYSTLQDIEKQLSRDVLNDLTIDDDERGTTVGAGTVTTLGNVVTGFGSTFLSELDIKSTLIINNEERFVRKITSDTSLILDSALDVDVLSALSFEFRLYINFERVTDAITKADSLIDLFLAKQGLTIPLNDVPEVIRFFSVDIAIYNLFGRKGLNEDSVKDSIIITKYNTAIEMLERIASGDISLSSTGSDITDGSAAFFDGNERLLTRETLGTLL